MLFSEPKISQFDLSDNLRRAVDCFSALQRAENFSILKCVYLFAGSLICFSALQRAENFSIEAGEAAAVRCCAGFSALQRAENFSIRLRRC